MARKLSITVPDDLAERLDREPDAEAFLIETARTRVRAEEFRAMLTEQGMVVTPGGRARAAARLAQAAAEWPPERFAAVREQVRQNVAGMFTEPPGRQAPAA